MQVTLETNDDFPLPFGKTAGDWKIWLWGTQFEYVGAVPAATFTGVANGNYQVAAQRLATDGTSIGDQVLRNYTHTAGEKVSVVVGILVDGVAL